MIVTPGGRKMVAKEDEKWKVEVTDLRRFPPDFLTMSGQKGAL